MDESIKVKSAYKIEKERKDREIYDEFTRLMSIDGAQVQAVYGILQKQFNIHSTSTIWLIRNRIEGKHKTPKKVR